MNERTMITRIRLIAIVCIVLFLGAPLFAETVTATGTIESIDTDARAITVRRKTAKGEKTAKLTVPPQAELLVDGQPRDLASLKSGQSVTISLDTTTKQITAITVAPGTPSGDSSAADDEAGFEPIFNGKGSRRLGRRLENLGCQGRRDHGPNDA